MSRLWFEFAVTNEKFRFIPVAKTGVSVDTFATVAAAADVKIWGMTLGTAG